MSVIYSIDAVERVVHLTTAGEPSFDEWRDTLLAVFSDPSFATGFNFISDRRRATPPGREFVEREVVFVREHEQEFGRCRWAAVVPNPATDSVAREVTSRAGMADVEVAFFYDLAEARRWVSGADWKP
jgi:hypothetical protein